MNIPIAGPRGRRNIKHKPKQQMSELDKLAQSWGMDLNELSRQNSVKPRHHQDQRELEHARMFGGMQQLPTKVVDKRKNDIIIPETRPSYAITANRYKNYPVPQLSAYNPDKMLELRDIMHERNAKANPIEGILPKAAGSFGNRVASTLTSMAARAAGRAIGRGLGSLFGRGDYKGTTFKNIDMYSRRPGRKTTIKRKRPSSSLKGRGAYRSRTASMISSAASGYGGFAGGNQIIKGSIQRPLRVNASVKSLSGDIYISHREFIGNVVATGGSGNITPFTTQTFPINVGLAQSFPWLSQIAQNFELYELQGCIFEYRPTSGELGATGTNSLGKVVMVTNYDPDAAAFTSTVQMENYDYANACKPSERMLHGVETSRNQRLSNMLYVRSGTTTKDKVLTDYGTFYIATEGLPVNSGITANLGELWVTYKVKLSRAQLFQYSALSTRVDQLFAMANGTSNIAGSTIASGPSQANASYLNFVGLAANAFAPAYLNSIGCTAVGTGANSFKLTFPQFVTAGVYRIDVYCQLASATVTHFTAPTSLTNCAVDTLLASGSNTFYGPDVDGAASTTKVLQTVYISIAAIGTAQASLVFQTATNNPPSASIVNVIVTQMPSNLFA